MIKHIYKKEKRIQVVQQDVKFHLLKLIESNYINITKKFDGQQKDICMQQSYTLF